MCVSECVCVCSQDWSSDCVGKEGDSCGRRPDIDGDEVEEGAARQVGTNDMRLEGKDGFPKRDRKYNSLKENTVFFHHFFFFVPVAMSHLTKVVTCGPGSSGDGLSTR